MASFKKQIVLSLLQRLKEELANVQDKAFLEARKTEIEDLLKKYEKFPEKNLKPSATIRLGSLVLTVEEWSDRARERWYFVGFGGELPLEIDQSRYQVTSLDFFQNQQVGGSVQTEEKAGINEMTLTHKIVYVT